MLFNISLHKITFRAKRNPKMRSLPCFVLTYLHLNTQCKSNDIDIQRMLSKVCEKGFGE